MISSTLNVQTAEVNSKPDGAVGTAKKEISQYVIDLCISFILVMGGSTFDKDIYTVVCYKPWIPEYFHQFHFARSHFFAIIINKHHIIRHHGMPDPVGGCRKRVHYVRPYKALISGIRLEYNAQRGQKFLVSDGCNKRTDFFACHLIYLLIIPHTLANQAFT